MVSTITWIRYLKSKAQFSLALGYKGGVDGLGSSFCLIFQEFWGALDKQPWRNHKGGHLKDNELTDFLFKHFWHGKMTFLHWNKGEEMAPTIAGKGATLLVRRIPIPDPRHVYVGDVVVLKNPEKPEDYLVRRLAATEGYEMASTDEKDESFVLDKNECWVVAENEKLKAKEAIDSRTFGPVDMTNIVGRVLYCLRNAVDHGRVQNSPFSMQNDSPVLEVELDVDEMAKSHKA